MITKNFFLIAAILLACRENIYQPLENITHQESDDSDMQKDGNKKKYDQLEKALRKRIKKEQEKEKYQKILADILVAKTGVRVHKLNDLKEEDLKDKPFKVAMNLAPQHTPKNLERLEEACEIYDQLKNPSTSEKKKRLAYHLLAFSTYLKKWQTDDSFSSEKAKQELADKDIEKSISHIQQIEATFKALGNQKKASECHEILEKIKNSDSTSAKENLIEFLNKELNS